MAAKKLPKGYYDPKGHVLVHKDYIDGLIDALSRIYESSGDPAIERICERALGQQMPDDWGGATVMLRREWAMPSGETFSVAPIGGLLDRWLDGCAVIVDPFARNSTRGTHRNDLNMATDADSHMDAADYCAKLKADGVVADAVLFDPPYSPRQVSELYRAIGRTPGQQDTQTARLYKHVRDGLDALLRPGGIAISFGWNSQGFGRKRGYDIVEILLVAHGSAHNDTIVVVERKALAAVATPSRDSNAGPIA